MRIIISVMTIVALSLQVFAAEGHDLPAPPELCSPANGSEVQTLRPVLCVKNANQLRCDSVSTIPTGQWTDFGGTSCTLDGQPVPVGSLIQAWDPQGVLCGERTVTTPGVYLATAVYGDEPLTLEDEGCLPGDTIRFTINCFPATPLGPASPIWVGVSPIRILNLSAISDSTIYHFELSMDSLFSSVMEFSAPEQTGTTTNISVPFDLAENQRFWWRVKTSNVEGESGYSLEWSFYVNSQNSAPTMFSLSSPPNSLATPLATRLPTFAWQSSFDPDPLDTIRYTFFLAFDSSSNFMNVIPGLLPTSYSFGDALAWGESYRWSVQANDYKGGFSWSNSEYRFRIMIPGDANASASVEITDVVVLINFIFAGGSTPIPFESGDLNCDNKVNIVDLVYLLNYIFGGCL